MTLSALSAIVVALYPGLLAVWRSGTFLLYSCKAAFWIQETLPRLSDVERSVILWSGFAIGSALAYLLFFRECATPPHVQVRHTMWLSFTRPSPALVLQATNAGVRRPGYEATIVAYSYVSTICEVTSSNVLGDWAEMVGQGEVGWYTQRVK